MIKNDHITYTYVILIKDMCKIIIHLYFCFLLRYKLNNKISKELSRNKNNTIQKRLIRIKSSSCTITIYLKKLQTLFEYKLENERFD